MGDHAPRLHRIARPSVDHISIRIADFGADRARSGPPGEVQELVARQNESIAPEAIIIESTPVA
jgi:hypothetical protein